MSTFTKALKVSQLPEGTKKTVTVGSKKIAIANIDHQYFAIDDTCSHEQCSLGTDGFLEGSIIVCGCHGSQFDMTNGKVLSLPAPADVVSYETKVEGEDIMVAV